MRETIYKCDRCGERMEVAPEDVSPLGQWRRYRRSQGGRWVLHDADGEEVVFDLCAVCWVEVARCLAGAVEWDAKVSEDGRLVRTNPRPSVVRKEG